MIVTYNMKLIGSIHHKLILLHDRRIAHCHKMNTHFRYQHTRTLDNTYKRTYPFQLTQGVVVVVVELDQLLIIMNFQEPSTTVSFLRVVVDIFFCDDGLLVLSPSLDSTTPIV